MGLFGNRQKTQEPTPALEASVPVANTDVPSERPAKKAKAKSKRGVYTQPLTVEMGASADAEVVGWTSQDPDAVRAQVAAAKNAKKMNAAKSAQKSSSNNASAQAAAASVAKSAPGNVGGSQSDSKSAKPPVPSRTSSLTKHLSSSSRPRTGFPSAADDYHRGIQSYGSPTSIDGKGTNESFSYRGGVMRGAATYDTYDTRTLETRGTGADTYYTVDGDEESFASPLDPYVMDKCPIPNPESLVMANLMQWKSAAEEGPCVLRLCIFMSALAMVVTSVLPLIIDPYFLTLRHGILSAYTFTFGVVIMILEGRLSPLSRNPVGFRAKLRRVVTKHFNVLRTVWGRGVFCMFAGTLHIAQMWKWSYLSGGCVAGFGLIAWILGCLSSYNLSNLRASLTNDEYLQYLFDRQDSDGDGLVNAYEFSLFLVDIGLELDDVDTLKAFNSIPKRRERKIAFVDFKRWWSQCKYDVGQDQEGTGNEKRMHA